jgi:hypothetical protein
MMDDLEGLVYDSDQVEAYETEPVIGAAHPVDLGRSAWDYRLGLGLTFVVGLLLGWIVIGWLLWPVTWGNAHPWDLRPKYQRAYINLAAENHWQSGDLSRVREALDGWDEKELTELIAAMQNETCSAEERRRLAALARVLELPEVEAASIASLLGQEILLFTALLSASPMVAAILLVVSPRLRERGGARQSGGGLAEEERLLAEAYETLLAQEQEEGF